MLWWPWQGKQTETRTTSDTGQQVFFGVDMGSPEVDYSVCRCLRCATLHHWQKRAPKRCCHCGALFNFIGLRAM